MQNKRISRTTLYMDLAKTVAKRGTCNRLQVGCVLVDSDSNRIVSLGYNSSSHKTPHCTDAGCLMHDDHCIRTLHAEQAAIMNLEHKYENLKCYVTHQPCINCFKLLKAANVDVIYYEKEYVDEGRDILNKELNVKMLQVGRVLDEWIIIHKPKEENHV